MFAPSWLFLSASIAILPFSSVLAPQKDNITLDSVPAFYLICIYNQMVYTCLGFHASDVLRCRLTDVVTLILFSSHVLLSSFTAKKSQDLHFTSQFLREPLVKKTPKKQALI